MKPFLQLLQKYSIILVVVKERVGEFPGWENKNDQGDEGFELGVAEWKVGNLRFKR